MSDPYYANGLMVTTEGMPIERPSIEDIKLYQNMQDTIRSYQQRGHLVADLDPLGIIQHPVTEMAGIKRRANDLVTRDYASQFQPRDMDRMFTLPAMTYIGGKEKRLKLR